MHFIRRRTYVNYSKNHNADMTRSSFSQINMLPLHRFCRTKAYNKWGFVAQLDRASVF